MADAAASSAAATELDDEELAMLETEETEEAADAVEPIEGGAGGSAAPKISRRDVERQLAKEQREIQERRLARLAELRDKQKEMKAANDAATAEKRLEFLMQQAEVFTHFMHGEDKPTKGRGRGGGAAGGAGAGAAGKRGHHAKTEDQEDAELVEEALGEGGGSVKLTTQPTTVTGTMREYQLEGLNWMINLHDSNISGILADEMGLGKTLQSISLLAYLKEYRACQGPHLVLVPKSTLGNWAREFGKWCPSLNVLKILAGDKEERQRQMREELIGKSGQYNVVVTSFETLNLERAYFRKIPWYYIVIDEAHRIKNEKSVLSMEIRRLDSQYRLLLTGTPLQNNLHELWALLNFLLPDVFSSSEDFDMWFSTKGGDQAAVIKKLHAVIRPFLLRRLKVDVERSLKPKIETKLYVGLTEMQRTWYKSVMFKDATALNAIGGPDRVRLLNILMQLRKVCNHPYLFDGAEPGPPYIDGAHLWENSGKMLLLDKLLPKLQAQGSRCLIFCQMTRMLDVLEDYCRLKRYGYCRIDGNTDSVARESAMDEYNAPGSDKFLFLLSTRAGGLGINLYTADVVILYDSDWNPQMDLQAMDRAHRIGQKKQVRVFRMICDRTVEEKIVERAERKLFLDAVVIQQGRLAQQEKGLSKGELMNMVKFGADEIFRGEGSALTDEDVDIILAKGEERTKAANERLKSDMAKTLGTLSMDDLLKSDTSKYLYEDTGDFGDIPGAKGSGPMLIPLPERERKRAVTYAVDEMFKNVMGDTAPRGRPTGPKLVKPPAMHDFQFFNEKRIIELISKENELLLKRKELEKPLKEAKAAQAREGRAFIKARTKELQGYALDGSLMGSAPAMSEAEATSQATAEWAAKEASGELEAARIEKAAAEFELSAEEKAEKDALLAEGFNSWGKRDFRAFITACERHGRGNKAAIFSEVAETTEKSQEEVARYYDVFWSRYRELSDSARIEERIEKGEQRIKRREAMETIIADKVARTPDPFRTLQIPYGPTMQSKGFTEEEDRFLICMLNALGYGAWDALKAEIRRAEQFRFDWFIKSRTPGELSRRCDALIRLLEKEAMDAGTAAGREIASVGVKLGGRPRKNKQAGEDGAAPSAGRKRKRKSEGGANGGAGKEAAADMDDGEGDADAISVAASDEGDDGNAAKVRRLG